MNEYVLPVPDEMQEELEKLRSAVYRNKSIPEIMLLMIWRGMGRTSELLKEKGGDPDAG